MEAHPCPAIPTTSRGRSATVRYQHKAPEERHRLLADQIRLETARKNPQQISSVYRERPGFEYPLFTRETESGKKCESLASVNFARMA